MSDNNIDQLKQLVDGVCERIHEHYTGGIGFPVAAGYVLEGNQHDIDHEGTEKAIRQMIKHAYNKLETACYRLQNDEPIFLDSLVNSAANAMFTATDLERKYLGVPLGTATQLDQDYCEVNRVAKLVEQFDY